MEIVSIAVSKKKKTKKLPVNEAMLVENHGIVGDAHAGKWHRQVSFLSAESIESFSKNGFKAGFGDFAENIATSGVDWTKIPVGTIIKLGESAVVEITQIGKECHQKCTIYYQTGDCIMPKEGIFSRVLTGGKIKCGDSVQIVPPNNNSE